MHQWVPHSASLAKVVRKMETFAAARRSGILLRVPAPGSTGPTSVPPFGLDDTIAPSDETIADLASASPAFSFVPPAPPAATAGAKDLIPSQPVNPVVDLRRTIDLTDLSRSLPVISGTPVVAGPTKSTMAASTVAAFAVGAVAMASVVQFHDPSTPHPRSCHTTVQLALPASMLMLLLAACTVACFDRLTSIHSVQLTTTHYHSPPLTTTSLPLTTIHYQSSPLTTTHYHSLPITTNHYQSLLLTTTHSHSQPLNSTHSHSLPLRSLPLTTTHYHSLPLTTSHYHSLQLTTTHYSLPLTTTQYHSLPLTTTHYH